MLKELTVRSVEEVMTVYSERGRYVEMKNRALYGLSFCRGGEIVYTHKGRRIVSKEDCAVFLPQGASYFLEGTRTGDFPLINFKLEAGCDFDEFICIPLHRSEGYLRDYEAMREQMLVGGGRLRLMSLFYGILHRLSQESTEQKDALGKAVSYLEGHYADGDLSNTVLAEQAGISEVYLRRLFKEALGTTPKQYVMELRLQRAKQLLVESNLPIGRVAEDCGFSAIYHFSAAFRALTGMTPMAYRRQNRRILL